MCIIKGCKNLASSGGRYPDGLCEKHADEWCEDHTMYKYIITGDNLRAMPVKTNMLYGEFQDYIRQHSKKLHKDSYDTVWNWGTVEFINTKVNMVDDYIGTIPAIIQV